MKRALGKALLAAWAALTVLAIGSLGVTHTAAMPQPSKGERLIQAMLALKQSPNETLVVHVIAAGCSCTDRLFAHLMERRPLAGAREVVVFAGEDPAKQSAAARAGFAFTGISPEELAARFGLEAAPVLFVFDPAGRLRYAGGYYSHPATIFPQDEKIHAQLLQGVTPEPLPVFGCAVSPRLQKAVDPLGIVYSKS